MIDHDYLRTDTRCPDCGGPMLIDVAYDDRHAECLSMPTVQGYDCQELGCGNQYTIVEWVIRTRSIGMCDGGGQLPGATSRGRRQP